MNPLRRLWLPAAYYLSWLLFGLGGLALNLVCAPFLLVPNRERFGRAARRATRWMFDFWLRWMHASGVVDVIWNGFDQPLPAGVIYLANHPSLVDAPFLLGRLTDTVCIFKPALLRNPLIAPAALLSGYVSGDGGVDGIRNAAQRVSAGCSLLIFPEGTRTVPGTALNPLRPGFALIARRARAPMQLIHVRVSSGLVPKGRAWWRLPPLPGRVEFTLGELLPTDAATPLPVLSGQIARRLETFPQS
jgi:1-acyl-sn-glycerol-3-phosphate acyltransferase